MELKVKNCNSSMELIEGSLTDEDIDKPKHHDKLWWRKVIYKYDNICSEIEDDEFTYKRISDKYKEAIDKKKENRDKFKNFIIGCLENSPFKTESGAFKINHPDIGGFSLSKRIEEYEIIDPEFWIGKGFKEIKESLKKKELNQHLKKHFISDGCYLIDPETGEIIEGVEVKYKKRFSFKK